MALWTFEWLSPGYDQNLADLRSAISLRSWSLLASRPHRWIALALEDCAKGRSGGRAALRKIKMNFLDQLVPSGYKLVL